MILFWVMRAFETDHCLSPDTGFGKRSIWNRLQPNARATQKFATLPLFGKDQRRPALPLGRRLRLRCLSGWRLNTPLALCRCGLLGRCRLFCGGLGRRYRNFDRGWRAFDLGCFFGSYCLGSGCILHHPIAHETPDFPRCAGIIRVAQPDKRIAFGFVDTSLIDWFSSFSCHQICSCPSGRLMSAYAMYIHDSLKETLVQA